MQQDGFDISLFPKKDTPAVDTTFDVSLFPKKDPDVQKPGEVLDVSLFPAKEKKKTISEKIAGAIGADASSADLPTMGELYAWGSRPPEQDPDIDEINPLAKQFLYRIPEQPADQTAVPTTPEQQLQLDIHNQQVAELIRQTENEQWNTLTPEQKDEYINAAMGGNLGRAESYGNMISGTIFKLAADFPKWSGALAQKFDKWVTGESKPVESYSAYYTGMKIQQALDEMFPTNRKYQDEAGYQITQGAASMIPYVFGGSLTTALVGLSKAAIPTAVVTGFLGAAQNSVPEYDRLITMHRDAHSLDQRDFIAKWGEGKDVQDMVRTYERLASDTGPAEDFAFPGFVANSLTGITEGMSMGWGVANIAKFLGTGWKTRIVSMLEAGSLEGFQESLTEYVANMSAIQAYDFSRRWHDNVAKSGGIGMLMGVVTFGIAGGLHQQLADPNLDPRHKAIIMKAIEENEQAALMVPENPNEIVAPKETEGTEKVRNKQRRHVVETVDSPPRTDEEKAEVLQKEQQLLDEEKATLGNPDAKPVIPVSVDPTPVEEPVERKTKPHRYFSVSGDQTGLTKNKRNDSNFEVSKAGEVDIIPGTESRIVASQAYNPLYEALNIPRNNSDKITVTVKPVIDPKTGDVLKRGELYFGSRPTKQQAQQEIVRHPEVSASKTAAIKDVVGLPQYQDAGEMGAGMLFKAFANSDEQIEITEGTMSEKIYKKLEKAGYVEDTLEGGYDTRKQAWTSATYKITDKGRKMLDAIQGRIDTRRSVKEGTDMFPYDSGINELKVNKDVAEMANQEMSAKVQELIQSGEITYTDDNGKPCAEAGGRVAVFTRGKKWSVVKDLKGLPSHEQGGVDLQITGSKVMFKDHYGKEIHAKQGLVIKCLKKNT